VAQAILGVTYRFPMTIQVTSGVLLDLIASVAEPGEINPALAMHVITMLETYLVDPDPR
jgi:hypothetical protein